MYPTKIKEDEIENATPIKCHLNCHRKKTVSIEFYMERENEEDVLISVLHSLSVLHKIRFLLENLI